ncbi:hypothetical protein ASF98_21445 [Arthrobacter sp. Leaf337]|jgi:hypothetical protein|uniref:hypothetical protein n=1 Tax=Arthrobacter sp. Leaf337 TaxID=1736342 RepID=UPI0006FE3F5E|nr:hypothetical protein [Arthrobacter sp. Leaf337]KQR77315.1 hypothetical protein ASF98_21445 [Arthrobacter sp. Leaf337]
MPLNYTPQFAPKDWIDQLDRVSAGGENGFNARFQAISAEFLTLSRMVKVIGNTLDSLSIGPPVQPVTLTLTPLAISFTAFPWEQGNGVVKSPVNADKASGFMPVDLPDGARLVRFTAYGEATGDSLANAQLQRQLLAGTPNGERIASVDGTAGTFTKQDDIAPGALATVDVTQFKYQVLLRWNWRNDVDQTALFSGFQIEYVPA